MKSKLAIGLIPISLLTMGFLTRQTVYRAWNAMADYRTPYAFSNPGAATSPPIADHVYIVLVDGLREDTSRRMSFLNELRARGADITCTVGLPSLSLPGRAVMMTGAWQEINGQLTNFNSHRIPIETLFQAAKKKGLTTALAAGSNVQKMFAPFVDNPQALPRGGHALSKDMTRYETDLRNAAAETRTLLQAKQPNLFLMDYTMTDRVAHDFGAASPQYARAAQISDEEIQKLSALIDFSHAVLIVTADHGHVDRGGHGGDEPEVMTVPWVMAGKGILPGTAMSAGQIDLAPTVAALLGTEVPAANEGRILVSMLAVNDAAKQALLEELFQQKRNFNRQYLSFVRGAPSQSSVEAPNPPTLENLESAIGQLDREAQTAKQDRIRQEPGARIGWVLPLIFIPLVGGILYLRRRWISPLDLKWGVLTVLVYWAIYFALFKAAHMAYSFSAVNVEERLQQFFGKDMAFAVLAMAVSIALVAGLRRRSIHALSKNKEDASSAGSLVRFSYVAVAMIAFSLLVKIVFIYWRYGLFVRWYVPNMHWGFGEYLDLLQLMVVGFTAWLAPLAAWLGLRVVPGHKEVIGV